MRRAANKLLIRITVFIQSYNDAVRAVTATVFTLDRTKRTIVKRFSSPATTYWCTRSVPAKSSQ